MVGDPVGKSDRRRRIESLDQHALLTPGLRGAEVDLGELWREYGRNSPRSQICLLKARRESHEWLKMGGGPGGGPNM
jgi:hypothetical protein